MSLHLPEQYVTYRIIGIDPGLTNLGLAVFDIDFYTNKILKIEAFTIANDKIPDFTGFDIDFIPERTIKLYKLKYAIQTALETYNPAYVVCEAPFYNRFMPMAYGALLEVVSMIHNAVLDWNSNIGFHTVAPLQVKRLVNTKAVKNDTVKGKELVKIAVSNIPEIMQALQQPLHGLSEHAIDAIAVGYTLFDRKV